MVLFIHRNFKALSDYDETSLIRNDANFLSNKNGIYLPKRIFLSYLWILLKLAESNPGTMLLITTFLGVLIDRCNAKT